MSIDVRNMFRKTVSEADKYSEKNHPYRKSLRERLEAARNISDNVVKISNYDALNSK